jgi:hypothetical protein
LNQDYREASRFMPPESVPTLELHRAGTGPFAGYDVRLKRHYVQRRDAGLRHADAVEIRSHRRQRQAGKGQDAVSSGCAEREGLDGKG